MMSFGVMDNSLARKQAVDPRIGTAQDLFVPLKASVSYPPEGGTGLAGANNVTNRTVCPSDLHCPFLLLQLHAIRG
jgi:hypothetical protein